MEISRGLSELCMTDIQCRCIRNNLSFHCSFAYLYTPMSEIGCSQRQILIRVHVLYSKLKCATRHWQQFKCTIQGKPKINSLSNNHHIKNLVKLEWSNIVIGNYFQIDVIWNNEFRGSFSSYLTLHTILMTNVHV